MTPAPRLCNPPRGPLRDTLGAALAVVTLLPLSVAILGGALPATAALLGADTGPDAREALRHGPIAATLGALLAIAVVVWVGFPRDAHGADLAVKAVDDREARLRGALNTSMGAGSALFVVALIARAEALFWPLPLLGIASLGGWFVAMFTITASLFVGAARRSAAVALIDRGATAGELVTGTMIVAPSAEAVSLRDAPGRDAALVAWHVATWISSRAGSFWRIHDGGCSARELPVREGDALAWLALDGATLDLRLRAERHWDRAELTTLRALTPHAAVTGEPAAPPPDAPLSLGWIAPGERLWVIADVVRAPGVERARDYRAAAGERHLRARLIAGDGGARVRRELLRDRAMLRVSGAIAAVLTAVASWVIVGSLAALHAR